MEIQGGREATPPPRTIIAFLQRLASSPPPYSSSCWWWCCWCCCCWRYCWCYCYCYCCCCCCCGREAYSERFDACANGVDQNSERRQLLENADHLDRCTSESAPATGYVCACLSVDGCHQNRHSKQVQLRVSSRNRSHVHVWMDGWL